MLIKRSPIRSIFFSLECCQYLGRPCEGFPNAHYSFEIITRDRGSSLWVVVVRQTEET